MHQRSDVRRYVLLSLWSTVFLTGQATAQQLITIFPEPLSPRIANYDINVTLDDEAKRITGDMVITWNNPSDDTIADLQFHLYMNAFKNNRSTFIRELMHSSGVGSDSGRPRKSPWEKDAGWGWIRIDSMKVDGQDVTGDIAYIQPDDQNEDDRTVIRVPLATPIAPRATTTIELSFQAKLPQCKRRMGWWADDFFMMSHWFPKIAVYETPNMRYVPFDAPSGRWNCHQFHAATEFYADYGVYDVRITLPTKYVVGTSGLIVAERNNTDGTKTVVARAEDVHEFAWVADAQFKEALGQWRHPQTGRTVDIRLLYQPGHDAVVNKYINSTKAALEHVHGWLGDNAYPYPNVTVIDPRSGSSAGGMEYPTLITGGASWWSEELFGEGVRLVEMVTIHEFMHQIWYGIVGSNEFEEAWLDEGFTSYSDGRISAEQFGECTSTLNLWGVTVGGIGRRRSTYAGAISRDDAAMSDWTFSPWNTGVGRNLAYNKTSLMLVTLENHLGRERFDRIMRTYYQQWRFKHPSALDFVAVANEEAGEDLTWFFDQLLNEQISLDYSVASIVNLPLDKLEPGVPVDEYVDIEAEDDADSDGEDAEPDDAIHESTVVFRRVGQLVFPVETLIEYSDGEVVREIWDGRDRVKVFRVTHAGRVVRAAIDPDMRVPLDVNRLNNSMRIDPNTFVERKYAMKGMFWMQCLLELVSIGA